MTSPLFDKMVTLAGQLVEIADIAYEQYQASGNPHFKEIAILSGMLSCERKGCKYRGVDMDGRMIYCKKHLPE